MISTQLWKQGTFFKALKSTAFNFMQLLIWYRRYLKVFRKASNDSRFLTQQIIDSWDNERFENDKWPY